VTLEENEKVIDSFLTEHPEFRMVEKEPRIGLPGLKGQSEAQRLFPHIHNCNGFYIATLFKK
jgi:16S rRNA C967 or C1407 C5-methylase (RsmB/RsmF family)